MKKTITLELCSLAGTENYFRLLVLKVVVETTEYGMFLVFLILHLYFALDLLNNDTLL